MEFLIPLKDILIGPGKRFDPSTGSEEDVIALIKKTYGFLAETMEVSIHEGMVRIKIKDATPEKINEALAKLKKAVNEAQQGRLQKALKLFQEVLAVIPEHVDLFKSCDENTKIKISGFYHLYFGPIRL